MGTETMKNGCESDGALLKTADGGSGERKKVSGGYRLEGKATIKYLPFDKSRLTCTVSSPLQDLVRWNAIVGELVRRGHPREDVERLTDDLRTVILEHLEVFERVNVLGLFTIAPKMSLKRTAKAGGDIEDFVNEVRNIKAADVEFGFVVRYLQDIKDVAQGFKEVNLSITSIDFADNE